jgi:hypothetical protein
MSRSATFVRPEHDATERRLAEIGDLSRRQLAEVGYDDDLEIVLLSGRYATAASLSELGSDVRGLVYFGHGSRDAMGVPPLTDAANIGVLSDRVVFALCCHSAEQLGPTACSSGARAYLGFRDLLAVVQRVAPWPGPFELALTHLLSPATTIGECADALRDSLERQRDRYMPGGAKQGHQDAAVIWLAAQANRLALHLVGDAAAELTA